MSFSIYYETLYHPCQAVRIFPFLERHFSTVPVCTLHKSVYQNIFICLQYINIEEFGYKVWK